MGAGDWVFVAYLLAAELVLTLIPALMLSALIGRWWAGLIVAVGAMILYWPWSGAFAVIPALLPLALTILMRRWGRDEETGKLTPEARGLSVVASVGIVLAGVAVYAVFALIENWSPHY